MPRYSTKKRKRFFGKRPQDIRGNQANEESTNNAESWENQIDAGEFSQYAVPLKKVKNMSAEKISNTDFIKKRQDRISTRSLTKSFGFDAKQPNVELAHGMKLQDFSLINEMLLKSSICRECRNPKSKLQVYQCNLERSGLAESLFVLCSHCSNKTPFYSSKKLPGKKGSFEVNRRSTSAATSRAELARFLCET